MVGRILFHNIDVVFTSVILLTEIILVLPVLVGMAGGLVRAFRHLLPAPLERART